MKKLLLSIMILCCICANAQTITTQSSCDSNGDGKVDINDVTNTANKVLGKTANETNVVTAEQLNSTLAEINQKLEELKVLESKIKLIEKNNNAIAEQIQLPYHNCHEYVDLGLSVKWATCNVGADNPEDYGLYFAWGETVGYTGDVSDGHSFDSRNLKYCTGETPYDGPFTKYVTNDEYGTVDGLTTLEPIDDAATVNWGGDWRMPTKDECLELVNNCFWEDTENYKNSGVAGVIAYKAKSDSDKCLKKLVTGDVIYEYIDDNARFPENEYTLDDTHVFFPLPGNRVDVRISPATAGLYWSSTLKETDSCDAYYLDIMLRGRSCVSYYLRYCGRSIRAVCP